MLMLGTWALGALMLGTWALGALVGPSGFAFVELALSDFPMESHVRLRAGTDTTRATTSSEGEAEDLP